MNPLDVDLVKRAQNGDLHAFEKLFLTYQKRVYNLVYRMTGNEADAVDLTQDAFIRAYRCMASLKNAEAFSTWLFRIAVNLCKNHRKAVRLNCDSLESLLDSNGEIAIEATVENPESPTEQEERDRAIQDALSALNEEHRAVVVLHHLEGLPLAEIANLLNCQVGTVKSRLARAREALKRRLRPYVEEGRA